MLFITIRIQRRFHSPVKSELADSKNYSFYRTILLHEYQLIRILYRECDQSHESNKKKHCTQILYTGNEISVSTLHRACVKLAFTRTYVVPHGSEHNFCVLKLNVSVFFVSFITFMRDVTGHRTWSYLFIFLLLSLFLWSNWSRMLGVERKDKQRREARLTQNAETSTIDALN